MKRILPILFIFTILICFFISFSRQTHDVSAALAGHVVISEIQVGGDTPDFASTDEFVELYNPTDAQVSLEGWKLTRQTAVLDSAQADLAVLSGTIPAHGFFLVAHTNYNGAVAEDVTYSDQALSSNNTVSLYSGATLVDRVGLGTSLNNETASIDNPINNRSVERKALSISTEDDMRGAHALIGNGEDTDNNANDFARHTSPNISDPQNSSSSLELPADVTPTGEPTPTSEPTPTGGVTPTDSPTMTPTPTDEPTVTPTNEPTPTNTPTMTPTMTQEPTPTSEPTSTPTPILTPTQTSRIIASFPLGNSVRVCRLSYRLVGFGFFKMWFPRVTCQTVPVGQ